MARKETADIIKLPNHNRFRASGDNQRNGSGIYITFFQYHFTAIGKKVHANCTASSYFGKNKSMYILDGHKLRF
jgi:hypothetical protein